MPPGLDSLKHIVVLMMENRSLYHMLGALKAKDSRIDGLTGSENNPDTTGATVKVQPVLPRVHATGRRLSAGVSSVRLGRR
jgi:phospholipase C